eukprot:6795046-Alexandrium_andersonii.AAC.1
MPGFCTAPTSAMPVSSARCPGSSATPSFYLQQHAAQQGTQRRKRPSTEERRGSRRSQPRLRYH